MNSIIKKTKEHLRTNKIIYSLYYDVDYRDSFRCNYKFEDRKKDSNQVCIVLAGYKELLWPVVFERITRFAPKYVDVCLVTSGMYNEKISEICKQNNWSYLSIKQNNVSLAQNVAIRVHPKAQYVFKLDEDIFITEGYFEKMLDAYKYAPSTFYNPGIICPMIPVNGATYLRIIDNYNLMSIYRQKFGVPIYDGSGNLAIHRNASLAKFMWGEGGYVPKIDKINDDFSRKDLHIFPCPIRFSIGAMLYERSFWKEMGYFKLGRGVGLGVDERQVIQYCSVESRPLMISENTVVGHLAFGSQNKEMLDFFKEHPEMFEV